MVLQYCPVPPHTSHLTPTSDIEMTRLSSCQLTVVGPPCQSSASSSLAQAGELGGVEGVWPRAKTVPAIPRVIVTTNHAFSDLPHLSGEERVPAVP